MTVYLLMKNFATHCLSQGLLRPVLFLAEKASFVMTTACGLKYCVMLPKRLEIFVVPFANDTINITFPAHCQYIPFVH